ncbi:MAG: choice-of-anchor L domain-containing protein, partial [Candidatus Thermoplasmatota archaeon]|nr:choice-of-anchor L domain-containing protein [Candidatus Thermoplasmatota archaeon]MBU1940492.1 choice-of-anchor L domain-containing protein [Candidatus Thermoplasmatota archaeon]
NQSVLIDSVYTDMDQSGHSQAGVYSQLGTMMPMEGASFILLSTGIAGLTPVTTDGLNPGSERGNWFAGGQYSYPRDQATLTLTLLVPTYMHYVYYDVQFFTVEYPDYIGTQYNDKLTITVNSPSQGISTYIIDVNGGDFVLNAHDIPGTGFDVFATSGNPANVDWLSTTPNPTGADGGATALTGREHPVTPLETITMTFDIKDVGDNQFDSTAFIDNIRFSGYAKTDIIARKTVEDINGYPVEPGDILKYYITISNIGTANQEDNPGNEFEDTIPDFCNYVSGSGTASKGSISFDGNENKILWDGSINSESSVALSFQVIVNNSLANGTVISNQGVVYWDSDESGDNDAMELTDDPAIDDGLDSDFDGETDDDDPTISVVSSYEPPSVLIEDFSDDTIGTAAQDSFEDVIWFTSSSCKYSSNFEVAGYYHYSTSKSFKIKLRENAATQYWNYSLGSLNSEVAWWELWFTCGNWTEDYELQLQFYDQNSKQISRIKLEYVQIASEPEVNYVLRLWYKTPDGWIQLFSDNPNGHLYSGWYKLRLETSSVTKIKYLLYQQGYGLLDTSFGDVLEVSLAELSSIEWHATGNPVACPLFFFDEHQVGLSSLN